MDQRLARLYPGLSAQERVLLMLRQVKADNAYDPQLRKTLPDSQTNEYSRLIGLIRGTNDDLITYVMVIQQLIEQLALRCDWLTTLHASALSASLLGSYFTMDSDEPITRSAYRELEAEAGQEWLPVDELAEILSVEESSDDESVAAWSKRLRAKRAEMVRLIKEGTLVGKGKGARLQVQAASYHAWRGEAVPVLPDWARAYDVRPDSQRQAVERDRAARQRAQQALRLFPMGLVNPRLVTNDMDATKPTADSIAAALVDGLREAWPQRWREVRAAEIVTALVAHEFDGEDALAPEARRLLDECRADLLDLKDRIEPYTGELVPDEPDEELLRWLREMVSKG